VQGLPRIAAEGCNVVDATTGDPPRHLLGASFVGPGVAELWHAVPCFPTVSEVWLRLLEAHRDTVDTPALGEPR
jgi:hypothetical protein